MVTFTYLAFTFVALAGAFAAPTTAPDADLPDFELITKDLVSRQDYNQSYQTSGIVNFSPNTNGYVLSFFNARDFVVGKGWKKGTNRTIIYSGGTRVNAGNVLAGVYGWTTDPLVEYIVEEYSQNGIGPTQGTKIGSVFCDDSVYEIWKHQQIDQNSILGVATFWRYTSNRLLVSPWSGRVTTECHFDAWKALGLNLGTHNYQTFSTKGWNDAVGHSRYTIIAA